MPRPRTLVLLVVAFVLARALLPAHVKRGLGGLIRTLAVAIGAYLVVAFVMGVVRMLV